MKRLAHETRRQLAVRGYHVLTLTQLPQNDGRKLKLCPIPSDPWFATIGDEKSYLFARYIHNGMGATADEAVLAALPAQTSLMRAFERLNHALGDLAETYR